MTTMASPTSNEVQSEKRVDRISRLPDPILHDILWRFRTKEIAKTMILSKRWMKVWASMPNYFLDDYQYSFEEEERIPDFVDFVDTMLGLREEWDIHTFRIWWKRNYDQERLNSWVQYVVNHNVRYLELDLSESEIRDDQDEINAGLKMPSCIFTSSSLEKLRMAVFVCLKFDPPSVNFSRLRILQLEFFNVGHDAMNKLISGCPELEELEFYECDLMDPEISSCSLKELIFINCLIKGTFMKITAPNLENLYLKSNDIQRSEVSLINLSSLVNATIQIIDYGGYRFSHSGVAQEPLKLTSQSQELKSTDSTLSTFPNLKNLVLGGKTNVSDNYCMMDYFLQRSPNLEELTLIKYPALSEFSTLYYECHYECQHRELKITVQHYEEPQVGIESVVNFLRNKCNCYSPF